MMELRSFLFGRVYQSPVVLAEVEKATYLISALFDYYVDHIEQVPQEYRVISDGDDLRAVCDFVAGMTDRYAKNQFQQLFVPRSLHY
ncbi:Deoxyguanosinetriphosphate triphosphohydrolase-like protein [bioreactor metagenome]|uniref:Deoxyguanosinetriphosphate triphosphohydrolase-like protein n=1 Tax=bioreactor metagenome TaxID=1076179 RepID=A0A645H5T5_9ZZZZ